MKRNLRSEQAHWPKAVEDAHTNKRSLNQHGSGADCGQGTLLIQWPIGCLLGGRGFYGDDDLCQVESKIASQKRTLIEMCNVFLFFFAGLSPPIIEHGHAQGRYQLFCKRMMYRIDIRTKGGGVNFQEALIVFAHA